MTTAHQAHARDLRAITARQRDDDIRIATFAQQLEIVQDDAEQAKAIRKAFATESEKRAKRYALDRGTVVTGRGQRRASRCRDSALYLLVVSEVAPDDRLRAERKLESVGCVAGRTRDRVHHKIRAAQAKGWRFLLIHDL